MNSPSTLRPARTSTILRAGFLALLAWIGTAVAANADWTTTFTQGQIKYFGFADPPRIERYDMAAEAWLETIPVSDAPAALLADETGLYASLGQRTVRFSPDGHTPVLIAETQGVPYSIVRWNDYTYIFYRSPLVNSSIDAVAAGPAAGEIVSTNQTGLFIPPAIALAPGKGRIFGSYSQYGDQIGYLDLEPLGGMGPLHSRYLLGNFSTQHAQQSWVFAGERKVLNDSGYLFDAESAENIGSVGGSFADAAFYKDWAPIVLRGTDLIAYSRTGTETGRVPLTSGNPGAIAQWNQKVFIFSPGLDGHGAFVDTVGTALLQPEEPGTPVNPRGLAYTPTEIFLDRDSTLYFFSRQNYSLFPWNLASRDYAPSIPLAHASTISYSPELHRIFLAYPGTNIGQIKLEQGTTEEPFASMPSSIGSITAAGTFLFVASDGGYYQNHTTLSPDGSPAGAKQGDYYTGAFQWSPAARKMYFFRDQVSPNDLLEQAIGLDGKLGTSVDSPYHGEVSTQTPIRPSLDGTRILLGSGQIFDAQTLLIAKVLPHTVQEAAWSSNTLYTIHAIGGLAQIEAWSGTNFMQTGVKQLPGDPLKILYRDGTLIAVVSYHGEPRITLLDTSLNVLYTSPTRPFPPSLLSATASSADSISLAWTDNSDNEDKFILEIRDPGIGVWQKVNETGANQTSATATGLQFSKAYDFRVKAANAFAVSEPSGIIRVTTSPDPRLPATPVQFHIVRAAPLRVDLAWTNPSGNEDTLKLERRTDPDEIWELLATLAANTTEFRDTNTIADVTYFYRITASNASAQSSPSDEVGVTVPPGGTDGPAIPSDLTAEASPTNVVLHWKDQSVTEDGFIIGRSVDNGNTFEAIGRTGMNTSSYADATARPNTSYIYEIAPYDFSGTNGPVGIAVTTPPLGGSYLGLSVVHRSTAYFAFDRPPRVERYDLAASTWLPPLPLPVVPYTLWVEDEGVYTSAGNQLFQTIPASGTTSVIAEAHDFIQYLFAWDHYLAAGTGQSGLLSLDRQTGTLIKEQILPDYVSGFNWANPVKLAVAPRAAKVFLQQSIFNSPYSGIAALDLQPDGGFGLFQPVQTPQAGAAYVFPDESRIADSLGNIYTLGDYTPAGDLSGPFDDLAFHGGDVPIVLRGSTIFGYTSTYLETGRIELSNTPARIFTAGTDVVAFSTNGASPHGLEAIRLPLQLLNPAPPAEPPVAYGLPFVPDAAFLDKGNVLYMLSRKYQALFRWSLESRQAMSSIPFKDSARFAAYSADLDRIYIGRKSGRITQIQPGSTPEELDFTTIASGLEGLATAGSFVFAEGITNTGAAHFTFAANGDRIGYASGRNISSIFTWSQPLNRIFYFQDDTSPDDLMWEKIGSDGGLGIFMDSPYHGDIQIQPPISVRPDGKLLLLGSGVFFDPITLKSTNFLPYAITDADWRGETLYTVRGTNDGTLVEQWDANFQVAASTLLSGYPLRVFVLPQGLLILTLENGQPRISMLDGSLAAAYRSEVNFPPLAVTASSTTFPESVPAGSVIATLSVNDPNESDVHRLELIDNAGGHFLLDGNTLYLAQPADYEASPILFATFRATDPYGQTVNTEIAFEVSDANEPPRGIFVSNSPVPEKTPVGSVVSSIFAYDPDAGDSITFALLEDGGGHFTISSNQLVLAKPLNYAVETNYTLLLRATDSGGLFIEEQVNIAVQEYVPPPVLGEVTLRFETASDVRTSRWLESGFAVASSNAFEISGLASTNSLPSNGASHLNVLEPSQTIQLWQRNGVTFRLVSLSLAELSPNQRGQVEVVRSFQNGVRVTNVIKLDGVADGPGPLADFQTFLFREPLDAFQGLGFLPPLIGVSLSGSGFAIGDIQLYTGPLPSQTIVRADAAEPIGFAPGPGAFEASPLGHAARVSIARIGYIGFPGPNGGGAQTIHLGFGGTANYLQDYFAEGLSVDGTLTLDSGTDSKELRIFPISGPALDAPKTIEVSILDDPSYVVSGQRPVVLTIYNDPFDGWAARRWPGATNASYLAWDADPDGNGANNLTEFALGTDPHHAYDLPQPSVDYSGGQLHLHLPHSKLAAGAQIILESSSDLQTWSLLSLTPLKTSVSDISETLQYDIDGNSLPAGYVRWKIVPAAP